MGGLPIFVHLSRRSTRSFVIKPCAKKQEAAGGIGHRLLRFYTLPRPGITLRKGIISGLAEIEIPRRCDEGL